MRYTSLAQMESITTRREGTSKTKGNRQTGAKRIGSIHGRPEFLLSTTSYFEDPLAFHPFQGIDCGGSAHPLAHRPHHPEYQDRRSDGIQRQMSRAEETGQVHLWCGGS